MLNNRFPGIIGCYCVQGDGGDDCDIVVTNIIHDGKYSKCMFDSATQPGTHIGVPPTGQITSTEAEQKKDASLFRVFRKVSVCQLL